ncbi:MAG: nucleoside hydrolase [Acidimicrobiia bacterium]
MARLAVLMDHDGGVDDYLATVLLMTMDHVDPLAVVVTPADCYPRAAVSATRKILDLMERWTVPVGQSTVRGVNPFPRLFRRDSLTIDALPILNDRETVRTPLVPEPGQEFMARLLERAAGPVTLLVTGPLTTVGAALDLAPSIEGKIREILWMGGALAVAGNVDPILEGGQDMTAEWNAYWDPLAVARVWSTSIPVTICPLDLTNQVPVTPDFLRRLSRGRQNPLYDFAGQCYALVTHQSYFFWDVLTTAYLGRPDLFERRSRETVVVKEGASQGRIKIEAGGRTIHALDQVDTEKFYEYVLQQWAR